MNGRTQFLAILMALFLQCLCWGGDELSPDEAARKRLRGDWKLVSLRTGDVERKAPDGRGMRLTFGEKEIVRQLGDRRTRIRYQLDTSKSPHHLDWMQGENGVSRRIVEVRDGNLRMAFFRDGKRPSSFKPKEGLAVVTFRRGAARKSKPTAARATQVELQLAPGALAFLRPDIQRKLKLEKQQLDKIREIIRATVPKYNAVVRRARQEDGADREKLLAQGDKIRAAAKQQVVEEVLRAGQRETWQGMIGKPATEEEKRPVRGRRQGASRVRRSAAPEIPQLKDLRRLSPGQPATPRERSMALWIRATSEHAVAEQGYVVLTDHEEKDRLTALQQLANQRKGRVLRVENLRKLVQSDEAAQEVRDQLKQIAPRFVAVAPRDENLTETTIVGLWRLLSRLDEDPQIDVFPGILAASSKAGFLRLIENSLAAKPTTGPTAATAICQTSGREGFRSFQKTEVLSREIRRRGGEMSTTVVGPPEALRITRSLSKQGTRSELALPGGQARQLPGAFTAAIEDASLLLLFGHGVPGMVCGLDIAAFAELDLGGKVVLSGCCFAGMGRQSDIAQPARGPDGSAVRSARSKFTLTAVDRGALVSYGHMRLSNGFPSVAPLLEGLLEGMPAGQIYQQLLNAVIAEHKLHSLLDKRTLREIENMERQVNPYLHLLIADPALVVYALADATSRRQ